MPAQIRFAIADRSHDAAIRTLLRESATGGNIALSFQADPSYFDAAAIEGDGTTLIALEGDRVICMGQIAVRDRYLNGEAKRIGYLGRLRLATTHAGRFDVLRRGYAAFSEMIPALNIDACFTSIAADNGRALRLLERNLPGLPTYQFAGDLTTLAIRTRRSAQRNNSSVRIFECNAAALAAVQQLTESFGIEYQFAPCWPAIDHRPGPAATDYRFLYADDQLMGCAALWDQREFRQTIIAGYSRPFRMLRPLANIAARLGRGIPLPPVGSILAQAFISHLAISTEIEFERVLPLFDSLLNDAHRRGLTMLAIGLDARDKRLKLLQKRYAPFVYRTRLYTVHWKNTAPSPTLDGRLLYPEIALL